MSNPIYNGSDKRLQQLFQNGGGGGGGTTVVANPSGEATDELEKLQVGETIYDIPTGGSSTLAGLSDVELTSPTDGQVLKYDAANDEWVNGEGGGSGGELYLNTIYSETEEKVGYWIDGKTLYEATIEVDNPTKQTFGNYYSYDANYSGHNIDYVQCIAKQCHDSHDQRWYDLPYHRLIDTESILCQGMKLDSTGQYSFAVFFRTSEQYDIDKIRYTIQYTKSS